MLIRRNGDDEEEKTLIKCYFKLILNELLSFSANNVLNVEKFFFDFDDRSDEGFDGWKEKVFHRTFYVFDF